MPPVPYVWLSFRNLRDDDKQWCLSELGAATESTGTPGKATRQICLLNKRHRAFEVPQITHPNNL